MANDEHSYHLEQPTLRQALILISFKIHVFLILHDCSFLLVGNQLTSFAAWVSSD